MAPVLLKLDWSHGHGVLLAPPVMQSAKMKGRLSYFGNQVAIMCLLTPELSHLSISTVSFIGTADKAVFVESTWVRLDVSPTPGVLKWELTERGTITTARSNSRAAMKPSVCSRGHSLISLSFPTSLGQNSKKRKKKPSKVTCSGCNYWHWEIEAGLSSMQCWRTSMSSGLHSILFQKY